MKTQRHENEFQMGAVLASEIAHDLKAASRESDGALIVLPGGSSAISLMEALANNRDIPWDDVNVTTTDERCVDEEEHSNNASQVERILNRKLPNLIRLWKDGKIADAKDIPFPATVTILGMGLDGHIASVFPAQDMREGDEQIFKTIAPKEPKNRVTLPFKVLMDSQRLILLITGSSKIKLVEEVLSGQHPELPVARFITLANDIIEIHMAP